MNLKEFARTLGLSQTTVSRALNGYPEVSEATRNRVTEAAQRLNYRPNTRARSLATGRTMAIGHVIPLSDQQELLNPIFTDFIAGASEVYHRNGYDMVISIVTDGQDPAVYRDLAGKRSIDGLIVHAPRKNDLRIPLLAETGLPFVVHGRATGASHPYSWVDVNNRRAFQRATEFLMDMCHRAIGLLNGQEEMDFAARRRDGYERALAGHGIPQDDSLMFSGEMTESFGFEVTRRLMARRDAPTALVVSSIITAIGVRRALETLGLRMGSDVSVIAYDDDLAYFRTSDDVPPFTSVRSSVREAGRRGAAMLLDLVATSGSGPRSILLEADLTIGLSTGPAPQMRKLKTEGMP